MCCEFPTDTLTPYKAINTITTFKRLSSKDELGHHFKIFLWWKYSHIKNIWVYFDKRSHQIIPKETNVINWLTKINLTWGYREDILTTFILHQGWKCTDLSRISVAVKVVHLKLRKWPMSNFSTVNFSFHGTWKILCF